MDIDPQGLEVAQARWPGIRVFNGCVSHVLPHLGKIAFANLDYTGTYGPHVQEVMEILATKVVRGSVIAYTFSRGRLESYLGTLPRTDASRFTFLATDIGKRLRRRIRVLHEERWKSSSKSSPMGMIAVVVD